MTESSPMGVFLTDAAGACIYTNSRYQEISGLTAEGALGDGWGNAIHPEDRERVFAEWAAFAASGACHFSSEHRFLRSDDTVAFTSVRAGVVTRGNEMVGHVGSVADVTVEHEAQSAVREAQERYRLVVENGTQGIAITSSDYKMLYANPALEQMFGYGPGELVGLHTPDLVSPETKEARTQARAVFAATGRMPQYETAYLHRDGHSVWTHVSITPMALREGTMGFLSTVIDITGRKLAEDALRDSEERYRTTFETLDDVYFKTDRSGRIVMMSPSSLRHAGYTPDELVGMPSAHVFADAEVHARLVSEVFQRGTVIDFEALMRRADGVAVPTSVNANVLRNADGAVIGFQGTLRDISERKREELEREELVAVLKANALVLEEYTIELDKLRLEAERLANYDHLTGVRNRRAWFAVAEGAPHSAVAVFDIDHFKTVNDTFGHPVGDVVLQQVAVRLATVLEGRGLLGRVGGEEFAAVFDMPFHEARAACEEAIAATAANPVRLPSGEYVEVTVSAGLVPWHQREGDAKASFAATYEEADAALYHAKRNGRRRLTVRGVRAA